MELFLRTYVFMLNIEIILLIVTVYANSQNHLINYMRFIRVEKIQWNKNNYYIMSIYHNKIT